MMRTLLLFLFSFLIYSSSFAAAPLNVGATAENWTLNTIEDEALDYYTDSDGKVSVIVFWASWCPYCATLMPQLEVLYRKYRSKGVKFYAINIFEDGKIDPVSYFKDRKFTHTMLKDGDAVAEQYGVKGTPGVYVIGKDKKVVYKRPSGVSYVLVKQNVNLRIKQALSQ